MMEEWERRMLAWLEQRRNRILHEEQEAAEMLEDFWRRHRTKPELKMIELVFHNQTKGERAMAPVAGAATLKEAGQVATASVLGFDQNGNPMPDGFVMPSVSYEIDNEAVATIEENPDGETAEVTAVSEGVAEVTASLKTAEGLELTDVQDVTVDFAPPPPPPTPVLTSIKLVFDVGAVSIPEEGTAPEAQVTTAAGDLTPNQKIAAAVAGQTT
ncbi:MAG TPA: hypothetical protein VFE27_24305 [Acidobacteriaceae bacterium]|jgi:hypothetical protein|nr:hypothetical protein [Acidobacteriaceae bacterium]